MKIIKKLFYLLSILLGITGLVFIGVAVMQFSIMAVSNGMSFFISEDMLYTASGTLGIGIACIIIAFLYKKRFLPRKEKFQIGKAVLYASLAVCICKILYTSLSSIVLSWLFPITIQEAGTEVEETIWIQILFGILLTPIVEEWLFRKEMYSFLRDQFSKIASVTICSVIFASVHGYELQGWLSCLLAGFLFNYLYDKTGVVWYSVFAHMLCNLEVLVCEQVEKFKLSLGDTPLSYELNGYHMYHSIIIFIAGVLCFVIIKNLKKKSVQGGSAPKSNKYTQNIS